MLFLSPVPASASPRSPWIGGIVASTRGFSEDSGHPPGEYLDLGLFLDPFQFGFLNPSASLRLVLPLFPFGPERSMAAFGIDLDLVSLRFHSLRGLLDQASALSPGLAASWTFGLPEGILAGELILTARVLRLKTGDARYSFLSPELILGEGFAVSGWGLRLFDFAYFMF